MPLVLMPLVVVDAIVINMMAVIFGLSFCCRFSEGLVFCLMLLCMVDVALSYSFLIPF